MTHLTSALMLALRRKIRIRGFCLLTVR